LDEKKCMADNLLGFGCRARLPHAHQRYRHP
jgi:hypothetical protein